MLRAVSATAAFELETAMAEELWKLGCEMVEMLDNMLEAANTAIVADTPFRWCGASVTVRAID
jgi:hypothetical protein